MKLIAACLVLEPTVLFGFFPSVAIYLLSPLSSAY